MEFKDGFSFGSYLKLVWRIEFLENQLRKRGLLHQRDYLSEEIIPIEKPVQTDQREDLEGREAPQIVVEGENDE